MALGVNWPSFLPGAETAEKVKQEVAGFKYSDLNSGPPFVELVSEDLPTFWDVSFKMTQDKARLFKMWLNENKHRTKPTWFEFPIKIESGLIENQEVRFVSYPQVISEVGNVFSYSARIMARAVADPDLDLSDNDLNGAQYILIYSTYGTYDQAANAFGLGFDDGWPKA